MSSESSARGQMAILINGSGVDSPGGTLSRMLGRERPTRPSAWADRIGNHECDGAGRASPQRAWSSTTILRRSGNISRLTATEARPGRSIGVSGNSSRKHSTGWMLRLIFGVL
jgi:hypothetical protein